MKHKKQKGFTLIELLVVIAIIGLLSTLAVVALGNARQKARDAKRMADLKATQTAFELFIDQNSYTPGGATVTFAAINADLKDTTKGSFMPGGLPEDPMNTRELCICKDTAAGSTKYLLATVIEQTVAIQGDLDDAVITGTYTYASECICNGGIPTAMSCADAAGAGFTTPTLSTAGFTMCLGAI